MSDKVLVLSMDEGGQLTLFSDGKVCDRLGKDEALWTVAEWLLGAPHRYNFLTPDEMKESK